MTKHKQDYKPGFQKIARKISTCSFVLFALILLILSNGCATKTKKEETVKRDKPGIVLEFSPRPPIEGKAAKISVKLPFDAERVVMQLKKEGSNAEIFLMKKTSLRDFSAIFLPLEKGIYFVSFTIKPVNEPTTSLKPECPIIQIISEGQISDLPEALAKEIDGNAIADYDNSFSEVKILSRKKIYFKDNKAIFEFRIAGFKKGEKTESTLYVVYTKDKEGSWFLSYFSEQKPQEL